MGKRAERRGKKEKRKRRTWQQTGNRLIYYRILFSSVLLLRFYSFLCPCAQYPLFPGNLQQQQPSLVQEQEGRKGCLIKNFVTCEQALYGAAEDLYGSCGGGSGRKGPVGMDCIFEFHIPDLRYMACFVIFPWNWHSKVPQWSIWVVTGTIDQQHHFHHSLYWNLGQITIVFCAAD